MNNNLLDQVLSDGHELKRKMANEYAGACPWCGGKDRFIVWTDKDRYWCRQCNKFGDLIQYVRDSKNFSFAEALKYLGLEREKRHYPTKSNATKSNSTYLPKEKKEVSEQWQAKANEYLKLFQADLWTDKGKQAREYLTRDRGLTEDTIRQAGIGLNKVDLFEPLQAWGLPSERNEKGNLRTVWLPAGIVIPCYDAGVLSRIRIRTFDAEKSKYLAIKGSLGVPLKLGIENRAILIVVETELDAWLLWQLCGYFIGVIALGSAQTKPDLEVDRASRQAERLLIALDVDQDSMAGGKSALWWLKEYPKAIRHLASVHCKDPGGIFKAYGQDGLRDWVQYGVGKQLKYDYATLFSLYDERAAIKEFDGKLSRNEAERQAYREVKNYALGKSGIVSIGDNTNLR